MPNFIIIGAAKCGTTSLCDDLDRHPSIFISDPKEIEYFCRDEKYVLGPEWYRSHFTMGNQGMIQGEGSTHYTDFPAMPHSAGRIASDIPEVKLVYMIRDPVRRAYSGWLQKIKNQDNYGGDFDVPRKFSDAIRSYPALLDCGNYQMQLERYLEHFDRSSIHVMVFEDYVSDRRSELLKLGHFLGFDPTPLIHLDPIWSNESGKHFERRARTELANRVLSLKFVRGNKYLLPKPARRRLLLALSNSPLGRRTIRNMTPETMDESDQRWLWSYYKPTVEWIELYLGRDLEVWRSKYFDH